MKNVATQVKNPTANALIIKLFNGAIKTKLCLEFAYVNEYAVKLGFLVHPDICNQEVLDYLKSQTVNYGSTFYKKWQAVISKSRFELFIDQLMHYASTYGTGHTGDPYIPEGTAEIPAFTTMKVLLPLSKKDVISRIEKMFFSGIALGQETIKELLFILDHFKHTLNIEDVKNKEAKMFLYKETSSVPKEPVEMVRYLSFLATEKSLLIKDKKTIGMIKKSTFDITSLVDQFGAEQLASVFFRFKPLFLAFKKTTKDNSYCVNRLRKLANKHHKPMKVGFFEKVLSDKSSLTTIGTRLKEITNFKKVLLLQTIKIRLKQLDTQIYLIRNQKMHIETGATYMSKDDKMYLQFVYDIIYSDLVASMKKKACAVAMPENVLLALPSSEKSFSGNYPFGTRFHLAKNDAIVGINWRGEDGAQDLDLSLIDIDGKKYGWNAAYKNATNSVIYSGDMTSANPEATELFYAANGMKAAIVNVNLFGGVEKAKFKFFLASEKITNMKRNYMVDPNNIMFTIDCEMDSRQKAIGVLTGNSFILAQFRSGDDRVARGYHMTSAFTNYALDTIDCYVELNKLLSDAGFTFDDKNPDIDLRTISKDSLINLLD